MSNSKASCHISSIGGACGADNVTNMWKTHFLDLYSDIANNKNRKIFFEKVAASNKTAADMPLLTIDDIVNAINSQKYCTFQFLHKNFTNIVI